VRWVLLLALGALLSPSLAEERPSEHIYKPLPQEKWESVGKVSSRTIGPVVVVAARFENPRGVQAGNGLVLRCGGKQPAWILTCAHIVRRGEAPAGQLRVGTFPHNYDSPGVAGYRESVATVVSFSTAYDLALLAVDSPRELRVFRPGRGGFRGPKTVVSVVPFGQPVVSEARWHPKFLRGQSGSPVLQGRSLVGLASNMLAGELGTWVNEGKIRRFLKGVKGGKSVLSGWRKAVGEDAQELEEALRKRVKELEAQRRSKRRRD
jgi:hypothetical protein